MRWIDEAWLASPRARRAPDGDGASEAIAVYSGGIHFFAPVRIGDLVVVDARYLRAGAACTSASASPAPTRARRAT